MADPARVHFRDPIYDGQLVRTLAAAIVGASDLGETMATARSIGKLNGRSWYDAWSRTGSRARAAGERALISGDRVGARYAFLRASEYYRQAYYFMRADLNNRQTLDCYHEHVEAFRAANELLDDPAELVRIPYERTTLAGYFFTSRQHTTVRPTLIFPCGYDSTAEAGWSNAAPALERGYNVLLFDGPGQGESLFIQRIYLRPDFEAVLTPVIDWLLTQSSVDPSRIVLVGRSFAGYLAPRAAAFEPRLAALVCDPAQPNMGARVPRGPLARLAAPIVRVQSRINPGRAEFFGARMAAHGVDTINQYFRELRRFNMLPYAKQISCPTLLVEAEHDFAGGESEVLRNAMTARAEVVRLTEADGADGHCAGLGQQVWAAAVYGWLNQNLTKSIGDQENTRPSATGQGDA